MHATVDVKDIHSCVIHFSKHWKEPSCLLEFKTMVTFGEGKGCWPNGGLRVELFQILKYDAVKVLHSVCQQIWKTQQWPQEDWNRSVFIPSPKQGNAKECSDYRTVALISHGSKSMLKVSKPGFRNTWTVNFQIAGFRKGRGTRNQMANIRWIIEKARQFQKNIYFCFTD